MDRAWSSAAFEVDEVHEVVAESENSQSLDAGGPGEAGGGVFTGPRFAKCDWWAVEPNFRRVAHGIPSRVDRLKGLGNALVPQIAEEIARRIKVML